MATVAGLAAIEEYLNAEFSPDREYVDGVITERNVGKKKHARAQTRLALRLSQTLPPGRGEVLVEQRVRVSSTRVRVPDVLVAQSDDEVQTSAPALCIEIMSPEDRWSRLQAVIADYQAMGVPCVWVIDPYERRAWRFDLDAPPAEVTDGVLRAASLGLEIEIAPLFA